ncbi:MAG: DUF2829 domain-containing protein [Deltaproteobacteria bacterium]|nr:DUF2829 domain-containing protein [Deltaproteobacteria bacterium]
MNIGEAITTLRRGGRVARCGWNGKNMWLRLVDPTERDRAEYVEMRTAGSLMVPWVCSQSDLLATDWVEVIDAP